MSFGEKGNRFAVYQIIDKDPQNVRFMGLSWMHSHGIPVQADNYELVYSAPFDWVGDIEQFLEQLFYQLNTERPEGFQGRSMSVSDVVAIKKDGQTAYYYCDSIGFARIDGFSRERI